VSLPRQFPQAYEQYLTQYRIDDVLFPFTDRFLQMLFSDLKKQTKMEKNSPQKRYDIRMWCGHTKGERIPTEFLTGSGLRRIREKRRMRCIRDWREKGYNHQSFWPLIQTANLEWDTRRYTRSNQWKRKKRLFSSQSRRLNSMEL